MMNAATVITAIILIIIAIMIVMGRLLSDLLMGIKRQSYAEAREWQEEHYDLSWYDLLEKET